jgi:hypothetical protein
MNCPSSSSRASTMATSGTTGTRRVPGSTLVTSAPRARNSKECPTNDLLMPSAALTSSLLYLWVAAGSRTPWCLDRTMNWLVAPTPAAYLDQLKGRPSLYSTFFLETAPRKHDMAGTREGIAGTLSSVVLNFQGGCSSSRWKSLKSSGIMQRSAIFVLN